MDNNLIAKLKQLKEKYQPEGFIILGVFGSYARNEQIKADIEAELKLKADLADYDALNDIGKKYILPDVYYVA